MAAHRPCCLRLRWAGEFAILTTVADAPLHRLRHRAGRARLSGAEQHGDPLVLTDNGTTIDAVTYDLSWYNDAVKDDGAGRWNRSTPPPRAAARLTGPPATPAPEARPVRRTACTPSCRTTTARALVACG